MLCFLDDLAIVRLDNSSTQKSVAPVCVIHIRVLPKNAQVMPGSNVLWGGGRIFACYC